MVAADQKPDIKQAVIVMAEGFLEAEVVIEARKEEVYPQPAATASEDRYAVHALVYTFKLGGSMSSGPKQSPHSRLQMQALPAANRSDLR